MDLNKQLQLKIGELIGKDYFKLEFGQKIKITKGEIKATLGKYVLPLECDFIEDYHSGCGDPECCGDWGTKYAYCDGHLINLSESGVEYEILGQEPTYNELFLAIYKIKTKELISPKLKRISEFWEIQQIIDIIDLEKSIFNQSHETKEFIINLINDI